jgi:hypothetical protein
VTRTHREHVMHKRSNFRTMERVVHKCDDFCTNCEKSFCLLKKRLYSTNSQHLMRSLESFILEYLFVKICFLIFYI